MDFRQWTLKTVVFFIIPLAAQVASAAVSGGHAAKNPKNIMIISWDGVQRGHLLQLLKDKKLPSLSLLIEEGKFVPLEVTTHKTDTKAGHAQMLSGYKPETTGVFSNSEYGPIPNGLSVFERIEKFHGPENIMTIALTGKNHHIGSMPAGECWKNKKKTAKKNKKKKGTQIKMCPAEPWNTTKQSIDVWDGDKQRGASEVAPLALKYIRKYSGKPFFFFLHLSDPDHAGHRHGENSEEYENAIIVCDTWLDRVRKELEISGVDKNTLIYLTTDHGFDEGKHSHKDAPHIWLATNDTRITAASGDQMDIAPMLLKSAGVPLEGITPPLHGTAMF